ncbi:MAG: hypothetical protein ACKO43_04265 [Alphaproteobacteria bacterium]
MHTRIPDAFRLGIVLVDAGLAPLVSPWQSPYSGRCFCRFLFL